MRVRHQVEIFCVTIPLIQDMATVKSSLQEGNLLLTSLRMYSENSKTMQVCSQYGFSTDSKIFFLSSAEGISGFTPFLFLCIIMSCSVPGRVRGSPRREGDSPVSNSKDVSGSGRALKYGRSLPRSRPRGSPRPSAAAAHAPAALSGGAGRPMAAAAGPPRP